MIDYLEKLQPRFVLLILAAILALSLLASYLYLFKNPLAEWRELAAQRDRSAADLEAQRNSFNRAEIATLRETIRGAESRLYGDGPRPAARDLVAHVVGELDHISRDYSVQLLSVTPGSVEEVLMFDEVPFDVSVQGHYPDLYAWLVAVETKLRPMVVKHFQIRTTPAAARGPLMELRIVSYLAHPEQS